MTLTKRKRELDLLLLVICGSRLIWVYTVFPRYLTFEALVAVYPISWAVTSVVLIVAYFVVIKRSFREIPAGLS